MHAVFFLPYALHVAMGNFGTMRKLRVSGPYKVGIRTFRTSQINKDSKEVRNDVQVLCYYPIDKSEYDYKVNQGSDKF